MLARASSLDEYRPVGGALCLDFANTMDWHASDHPVELLCDPGSLAAWARIAGAGEMEADDADLRCAIELRDALWDIFLAVIRDTAVPAAAVAVLNRNLELAPERRHLAVVGARLAWSDRSVRGLGALLLRIARSAADLLTDAERLSRVRMCASLGCGWLFLDESRGGRRRWCSMATCGNRAKARQHYQRKRKKTSFDLQ